MSLGKELPLYSYVTYSL